MVFIFSQTSLQNLFNYFCLSSKTEVGSAREQPARDNLMIAHEKCE
jgi:hypothetical protein